MCLCVILHNSGVIDYPLSSSAEKCEWWVLSRGNFALTHAETVSPAALLRTQDCNLGVKKTEIIIIVEENAAEPLTVFALY